MARANTSKAVSVPSRDIRRAVFMVVMIVLPLLDHE